MIQSSTIESLALSPEVLEQTAGRLKALAHPVRLAIIDLLRRDKALSVTAIYEALGVEQAVASQHLSILREHHLVHATRDGKHTLYSLKQAYVLDVIALMLAAQPVSGTS